MGLLKSLTVYTLTFLSSFGHGHANQDSALNGYAFDCGGLLMGLEGDDQIYCMNGSVLPCGDYAYDAESAILSGYSSLTGPFTAWHLDVHDGVLVSFQSDLGVACNVVSLDWRKYSTRRFLGLKCPVQNKVPSVSFQDNHFSLGVSGDVALRSPLELTASGRRLIRDSYGVFQWFQDDTIRFYFGTNPGQQPLLLEGQLTDDGELLVNGFQPPGPCTHDGTSALYNTTELPRQPTSVRTTDMMTLSTMSTPGPVSTSGASSWRGRLFMLFVTTPRTHGILDAVLGLPVSLAMTFAVGVLLVV